MDLAQLIAQQFSTENVFDLFPDEQTRVEQAPVEIQGEDIDMSDFEPTAVMPADQLGRLRLRCKYAP